MPDIGSGRVTAGTGELAFATASPTNAQETPNTVNQNQITTDSLTAQRLDETRELLNITSNRLNSALLAIEELSERITNLENS